MFYLIGLGLNEKGYSREAYDSIMKSDKIYIETYTVELPYKINDLEKQFPKKKFILVNREDVESLEMMNDAKKQDIALLVYGSPFTATTHISLIQEARKRKIKVKIIHSASIFDAVAETGLQIYKFGKTASMPNFEAESFVEIIKENQKINAHSLILIDIGMDFKIALERLEKILRKNKINTGKIVVCSKLGAKESRIFYGEIQGLKSKKIENPFCFVIVGKTHFLEEEILETFQK